MNLLRSQSARSTQAVEQFAKDYIRHFQVHGFTGVASYLDPALVTELRQFTDAAPFSLEHAVVNVLRWIMRLNRFTLRHKLENAGLVFLVFKCAGAVRVCFGGHLILAFAQTDSGWRAENPNKS